MAMTNFNLKNKISITFYNDVLVVDTPKVWAAKLCVPYLIFYF